ncbi:TfoX/Sxy family DNA transformation protein [Piscinibacterium candidicorallinum]|jgi:DNA transformation protein|uniref:TfoX/Sxy family DNA transformation protein n=1 Tax=Piscinibacterium candidicorallinum TaxID=1793872 RepID=A0ABV7H2R3_9BURK
MRLSKANRLESRMGQAESLSGARLAKLSGIGPVTAEWLMRAGFADTDALRKAGSVNAYQRCLQAGHPENLNLLWALEGALTGRDWREVARTERERLLFALDDMKRDRTP